MTEPEISAKKRCLSCQFYVDSETYAPTFGRFGLAGYGYCEAGATVLERARFFSGDRECWLTSESPVLSNHSKSA